jgi:DNA-binding transcriptional MerR regulator
METKKELTTKLSINYFTSADTLLSYRTLNHYDELGLLLNSRENKKNWRKFNSIELIWINLISILREIGFPLKKILKLKKKMFEEGRKGMIDKANFINKSFEEEIIQSLTDKYELYILIFSDCHYTFQDSNSIQQWGNSVYKNEPHINIPLSQIISDVTNSLKSRKSL